MKRCKPPTPGWNIPRIAAGSAAACLLLGLCLTSFSALGQDGAQKRIRNVTPDNIPVIILPPRDPLKDGKSKANELPIPGDSLIASVTEDGTLLANGKPLIPVGTTFLPANTLCESPTSGRWACGLRAYVSLRNFVHGKELKCEIVSEKAEGALARCYRERSNVSDWLLSEGWALYDPSALDDALAQAAEDARKKLRGIWANGSQPVTVRN